jgi:phospholipase A1
MQENGMTYILKKISLSLLPLILFSFSSYTYALVATTNPQDQSENITTTPAPKKITKKKHHKTPAPQTVAAEPVPAPAAEAKPANGYNLSQSPVVKRASTENKILQNPFGIAFYQPTYVIPFYYTGSPYNSVYAGETPQNESLKKAEVKYQLSFKVPIWGNILNSSSSLYFAYTQLSYWQLYDRDAFFRETDYQPEFFLANEFNFHLFGSWHVNFLNVGAMHESNGYGGTLERSWNRMYVQAIASSDNWVISFRPWIVFHDSTYERQNPNMADYLGHEQITLAYKYGRQVFSLQGQNVIEYHARRSGLTASWSFPITKHLNGYLQAFSGYGQSLIEYNHHTNSIGIGIAFSNFV